jgi:hypothetical protein
MADPRTYIVPGSGTGPGGRVTNEDAGNKLADKIDRLGDNSLFYLTVTSGGSEGDDVTAQILDNVDSSLDAWALERGWFNGMGVSLIWPADNTGAVTLAVNGGAALDVKTVAGAALTAGQLPTGLRVEMRYFDGDLIVMSPLPAADDGPQARYYWQFVANGIWTKPAGLADDTLVTVEAWGAGGGSNNQAGGGGGAYALGRFRIGDLTSTVAVTVGAGGPGTTGGGSGGTGGNSFFGGYLTAYGGGRADGGDGGGGGGSHEAGGQLSNHFPGRLGGGRGYDDRGSDTDEPGTDATTIYGGGGGGGGGSAGYWAVYGGGGGAASGDGGKSVYGGDGGDVNQNGQAPGGGAGRRTSGGPYSGGRGEVRVWI